MKWIASRERVLAVKSPGLDKDKIDKEWNLIVDGARMAVIYRVIETIKPYVVLTDTEKPERLKRFYMLVLPDGKEFYFKYLKNAKRYAESYVKQEVSYEKV